MEFKRMTAATCLKTTRSRGQRSRWHRDITCAKIRKIINNSAADCSISLKFCTDFDHVTFDVPRTFKVNGSKVKITAWYNVSASKIAIHARISCRKWGLVKIISEPSATHVMFKLDHNVKHCNRNNSGLFDCVQIWHWVSSRHRR